MAKVIGIDLGTTNSVFTIMKDKIDILQNKENEDSTPSVVSFYKNQILVGSKALDRIEQASEDTIFSIKRLMGRAFSDKEVQKVKEYVRYKIIKPTHGTENDVRVILGGKEYSPIQISSLILKKIKTDAEMRLSDKVEYAVITVPAYFTDKQREATWQAGRLAGLNVQKILDEPTAAAIAFGMDKLGPEDSKTILVYDLGGGTFDVSVLTVVGGVFAKLDNEGDMWLGGDDFDRKIMDLVLEKIKAEYGVDASQNTQFMVALKKKAEKAKIDLSSMTATDIVIIGVLKDSEGNLIDVELDITRDQFESMIADQVKRSVDVVRKALNEASNEPEQIDYVLMVGGSSSIPMVRRALVEIFGEKKVYMNIDPMKCVGIGAGILAQIIGEIQECPICGTKNPPFTKICQNEDCRYPLEIVGDVTAMPYGIQTVGDLFEVIIEKGTPFPTQEPVIKTFRVSEDNLRRIKVPIFAGEKETASENEHQATVWLQIPENVKKGTPVEVALSLNDNGSLEKAKVRLKEGPGKEVEVFLDRGGEERSNLEKRMDELKNEWDKKRDQADSKTAEKVNKQLDEAATALNANSLDQAKERLEEIKKNLPGDDEEERWKIAAVNVMSHAELVLSRYGHLLNADDSYKMKKSVEELKQAVENNDEAAGKERMEALAEKINNLPGLVKILHRGLIAAIGAEGAGLAVLADKAKTLCREIEDCIKRNDLESMRRKADELILVINEIFEKLEGEEPPTTDEGVLEAMKKHQSSGKL
jgi:molecular chaperone DnaK